MARSLKPTASTLHTSYIIPSPCLPLEIECPGGQGHPRGVGGGTKETDTDRVKARGQEEWVGGREQWSR